MPNSSFHSTQHNAFVDLLAPTTWLPLVNDALRTCQSLLALSRSPLANSPVVAPALVKDDVSPTAEERGGALRLVLRWAVEKLAPSPAPYPFGVFRPFDDPTWRDPRWWRYTILRHRYLEPLHPDDFTGGGRFTETLLALTGISSADAFYDERNRAIGELSEWLRRQLLEGAWSREIQQLALQEALAPLAKQPALRRLLAIATAFEEVFPREQLLALARREGLAQADALLDEVIAQRFLLTGDGGANLWLAPPLRAHLYARQPVGEMQQRHRLIAAADEMQPGRLLSAIRHYQRGGQDERAAHLLLAAAADLFQEASPDTLIEAIQALVMRRLAVGDQYALALLLSDLLHRTGRPDAALAAGRQALQAARTPEEQARVYRRIGKLYETRNPQHALRYYQQAIERFPADAPELAEALKDRGWLHFLRQDWPHAEADLLGALEVVPAAERALQGAIYDVLANLYRKSGDYARAISYAELALTLREEGGDLLGIAKSHGNLGLLYRTYGDYDHAIAAYTEAMTTYVRLGNQELVAVALLNIGAAHFLAGNVAEAVRRYQESLEISQTLGLPLLEIKAHYNLAEAYAASGAAAASEHWQLGVALCRRHGFDDQEKDFAKLSVAPRLAAVPSNATAQPRPDQPAVLAPDEAAVLALAQREQRLTAQRLVEALHVSRATATRRLTALTEMGYLQMEGKGRGVHYRLASTTVNTAAEAPVTEIDDRLRALFPTLHQQFAVDALGLTSATGIVRIVVRFQQPPSLARFFELERYIGMSLQLAVDLVPESALDNATGVRWLEHY
ncbi:MAG TPA: tetratricopeptide repeat protein [Chloroflexi bacterium]|nr:tetratricopeptide repeat protein [Chloroflexota bacterium]